MLKERYALDDDDFLSYVVLNAFNSGEVHMKRAMKVMATEPTVRALVDHSAETGGGKGLFTYLTTIYIQDWKKWQDGLKPKYHTVSADYVYQIESFRRLHEKEWGDDLPEARPTRPEPRGIRTWLAAAIAAVCTGALQGTGSHVAGLLGRGTRREFFAQAALTLTAATGAGGAAAAARHIQQLRAPRLPALFVRLPTFDEEDVSKHPTELKEIHTHCRKTTRPVPSSFDAEKLIKAKNYHVIQCCADASFELYQQKSENSYLQIAHYFYQRAALLLREREQSEKPLSPSGQAKLEYRKAYIQHAHTAIENSFR